MSTREEMREDARRDALEELYARIPCGECGRVGEHAPECPDAPHPDAEDDA